MPCKQWPSTIFRWQISQFCLATLSLSMPQTFYRWLYLLALKLVLIRGPRGWPGGLSLHGKISNFCTDHWKYVLYLHDFAPFLLNVLSCKTYVYRVYNLCLLKVKGRTPAIFFLWIVVGLAGFGLHFHWDFIFIGDPNIFIGYPKVFYRRRLEALVISY